jgi:hypothetical protein
MDIRNHGSDISCRVRGLLGILWELERMEVFRASAIPVL